MISDPEGTVLALFLAFCRIGGCMMVLPGFSSARLAPQIRLFASVAVSMAVLPVLWDTIYPQVSSSPRIFLMMIGTELAIGFVIGLIARYYVIGLQFTGTVISMMIGFNSPPASDILEDTSENQLVNLISFSGLMILFMLDFHHQIFRALVDSYQVMPMGGRFNPQDSLITLTDTLKATFFIMLRLSSPFIIYGMVFNVSIGLVNKLAPQIPIYFISVPYMLMGGIALMYFGISSLLRQFASGFLPVFNGF